MLKPAASTASSSTSHCPFKTSSPTPPSGPGPAVFRAFTDPNLLDVVESLIGPEIYSNPVQHVRIKPPEHYLPKNQFGNAILGATQWHQDHGVVTEEADDTQMLTIWFSLQDTPIEKGPLMVAPGSHKSGTAAALLQLHGTTHHNSPARPKCPKSSSPPIGPSPCRSSAATSSASTSRPSTGPIPTSATRSAGALTCATIPLTSPTGRIAFPGFVARSRRDPDSELRDPAEWHRLWLEARAKMATINQDGQIDVPFRREQMEMAHPLCA